MFQRRVVIVSGLGTTGRLVFERLQARCVRAVPVSRTTRPVFDWRDRSTWPGALDGATAAYVTYPPGLGTPAAPDDIGALAAIAAELGVEHLVLLSVRDKRRVLRAERRLRAAPLDYTIIRAAAALGTAPEVVADLAVAALCDPTHLNRTYEIGRGNAVVQVGDVGGRGARRDAAAGTRERSGRARTAMRIETEASHSS